MLKANSNETNAYPLKSLKPRKGAETLTHMTMGLRKAGCHAAQLQEGVRLAGGQS